MRPSRLKKLEPGYLLAAGAALVPVLMMALYGKQKVGLSAEAHFWPVVAAAGTAAFVAIGLTSAGVRARDGRVILLGTAFSTTTALLAVHGFATPGVVVGMNGVIALAGGISIPVGAALLALTALPGLRQPRRIAPLLIVQGTLIVLVLGLGGLALAFPSIVPMIPKAGSGPAYALLAFGLACLAVLAHRAIRTHALTHRPTDLLVVAGCAWLGVSLFAQLVMGPGSVAFYSGHAFELGGIALIGIPTALDLAHGGASRPLVGDLTATELVAAEEAYLGMRVRSLLIRLADRDRSTEEHTRRVALLAARVGEELKLSPAARRHLAMGGLLHDVGKLSVALEILQKPGPLTDEEFAEIRRHPESGRRLLEELGGFPETVRKLVSDHHERLDGTGYPAGLQGCDLSIETRILAACDVYDALVSDRVYRAAWTPERALALLHEESGTGFDPKVVEALERIVTPRADEPSWVAGLAAPAQRPATRPAFRRA
ncbi:MAG TPA: HD-GYP domain-containing protein [Solirubrobacteraceae bacterium]|nr:HD-GYP domain-containing protein [Solirubrobacteraceae bacterium]